RASLFKRPTPKAKILPTPKAKILPTPKAKILKKTLLPVTARADRKRGCSKLPAVREVAEALVELLKGGGRGVLSPVVRTSGSTPQQAGARLLLRPDGSIVGTVGGGAIEHAVLEAL